MRSSRNREDARGLTIISNQERRIDRHRLTGGLLVLILILGAIGFWLTSPSRNGGPAPPGSLPTSSSGPTGSPEPTFTPPDVGSRPNAGSTGVPDSTSLTRRAAGTVRKNGVTILNRVITGDLLLSGRNITLRNTRVEGTVLVTGSGATIEDSSIGALAVSGASNITARRLDIFSVRGTDGIGITSDTGPVRNVLIEGSWIHSPKLTPASHYDGLQARGVHNLTIRGNYFDLGPHQPELNSAIFTEQANGDNFDVTIERNWIDGGGYALYLGGTGITLSDNIFGAKARFGVRYPAPLPTGFTQRGNLWADSGKPLTLG